MDYKIIMLEKSDLIDKDFRVASLNFLNLGLGPALVTPNTYRGSEYVIDNCIHKDNSC